MKGGERWHETNTTLYRVVAGLFVIGGLLMWFVPRDSMSVVFPLVIWLAIAAVAVVSWVADKTRLCEPETAGENRL